MPGSPPSVRVVADRSGRGSARSRRTRSPMSAASSGKVSARSDRARRLASSAGMPSATIASRSASCAASGSPCRARLCFSLSRPARMSSRAVSGNFSVPSSWNRRLRRIPTASATASHGASRSWTLSARSAEARSSAFRSSRTMFSMSCWISRRSIGTSRTMAGMLVSPAIRDARQRRSP